MADRQIEPEEEITYDYGKEYLQYFIKVGGCKCAACRRKEPGGGESKGSREGRWRRRVSVRRKKTAAVRAKKRS